MAPLEPLHFCLSVASAWLPLGWRVARKAGLLRQAKGDGGDLVLLSLHLRLARHRGTGTPPRLREEETMTELACRSFQSFPCPGNTPPREVQGSTLYPYEYQLTDLSFSRYFPFPCCHASVSYFNHTFGVSTTKGAAIRSGKDVQEWSATIFHLTLQRLISDGFSSENVNIISMPAPLSPMPLSVLDSDSDSDL
ncbi:hypothetical protein CABS01_01411 [Colletotrichum abscissum]|uniref:uncharacterized protein n=1 Tax=Colletotrichum abscissum TaxID=1671311 RepID=UPI0027D4B37C|nr:uncharacterized protein CABS01_01411 [Colletotrichum abscissum]KAK1495604.1 hypothetical protein CABS01_01411 [Colletotrichum abscissum]